MRSRLPGLAASLAAGLALALGGFAAVSGSAQAATPPGLHISNGKVVEKNGSVFVMRGTSHAHTWYTSQTATAIPAIKSVGANTLRVVLSSGGRWTKNDAADVANVVSQCKAAKLICMLEVHDTTGYGEDGAAVTLDSAANYWISIKSALVGQEDYVMLNIGNEPYGNGNAGSTWAADTSAAIKKLRTNGFRNLIVVDAPAWGQDAQGVMRDSAATVAAADPDANTLFSVHMYSTYTAASTITNYLNSFVSRGLPLIVGEFGNYDTWGDTDEDTILAETQRLGLGWLAWSWSGNSGGAENLDMVTGFNVNSLTPWGQRVVNGANGLKATAKEATIFGGVSPTTPPVTTTPAVTTTPPMTTTSAPPVITTTRPPVTTTTPPPVTTTGSTGNGGCTAVYTTGSAWGSGFVGSVKVTAGTGAVNGWTVALTLPAGTAITNLWNGTQSGTTVSNAAYNGKLPAGGTAEFGFQGTGSATGITAASCTAS